MVRVKQHTRKTKSGIVKVKAHSRRTTKYTNERIWEEVKRNYPLQATPADLVRDLVAGKTQGYFIQYGFKVPFHLLKETVDAWVVSTDLISRSGLTMGGVWYIPKTSPRRGVFD